RLTVDRGVERARRVTRPGDRAGVSLKGVVARAGLARVGRAAEPVVGTRRAVGEIGPGRRARRRLARLTPSRAERAARVASAADHAAQRLERVRADTRLASVGGAAETIV